MLVAEDNPANQLALDALLERCGVKADFVSDGRTLVELARTGRYSLVLLDLMMPGMTGFEAAKEIRHLEYGTGRHTPIVAVTALDPDLSRAACIEAGMQDLISKPIELETLQERLARWLPLRGADVALEERRRQPDDAARIISERLLPMYGAAAILQSFLILVDELTGRLEKAIAAQDVTAAETLAHGLKAPDLAAGVRQMARLSRQLERDVRAGNRTGALGTTRDLIAAYKRVTEELIGAPLRAIPLTEADLA